MHSVKLQRFMGYTGEPNITGTTHFIQTVQGVEVSLNLSGLEANMGGMWHVHEGTCVEPGLPVTVSGHDTFHATNWNSNVDGIHNSTTLLPSITLEPLKGKVLIIHDSAGLKAACGEIVEVNPGCHPKHPVLECKSSPKAFDKNQVQLNTSNNELVITNTACIGISIKSINLVLDKVLNNPYLKSYSRYTGFYPDQKNPTNVGKYGSECFTLNEGYLASYGTYTYSNFIDTPVSLKNNVGTNDISLKHGTFVTQADSPASGPYSALAAFNIYGKNPDWCPHAASHQSNMITSVADNIYNLLNGEGEVQPPVAYKAQNPTIGSYNCPSAFTDCILYPIELIESSNGPINVAWVNSAYNIYNFNDTALSNHNKIALGDDEVASSISGISSINTVIGQTTSYRKKNTRYSASGPNNYDIHIKQYPSGNSPLQADPGYTQIFPPPLAQDSLKAYKTILDDIISENIFSKASWSKCKTLDGTNSFDGSWKNSIFYIGPKLPSLPEYADIEKQFSPETNYGGKYIQLNWQTAIFHEHRTIEFYITRANQFQKTLDKIKNKDTNLNIMGKEMNGLASFSDTFGTATDAPITSFNIPLFVLHRALSMGPKDETYIGSSKVSGCIDQDPQALYKLKNVNNIFHCMFMWSVTNAGFWQQPFNLIFTNEPSYYDVLPYIIVVNKPEGENIVETIIMSATKKTIPPPSSIRLYQWGHYTLNLTGWAHQPAGVQWRQGALETSITSPTDGALNNKINNIKAFDKKYSVTDPWGEYSADMSANYFQTFNGSGGPSPPPGPSPSPGPGPTPIISASGQHHTPTPAPGPVSPTPAPGPVSPTPAPGPVSPTPAPGPVSPTPAPGPVSPTPAPGPVSPTPAPGPLKCDPKVGGIGCPPISGQPHKIPEEFQLFCNIDSSISKEPNKLALGWNQAIKKGDNWADVKSGKLLSAMGQQVKNDFVYGRPGAEEWGLCEPWNAAGQASLGHSDFVMAADLGDPNTCDGTSSYVTTAHSLCDYKTNCWSNSGPTAITPAGLPTKDSCKTCEIDHKVGGCKYSNTVYTGDHYVRMLDKNLNIFHTHHLVKAISLECLKKHIHLTSKKELFNGRDYHPIEDTTYLYTDKMVYHAIPNTLDKDLSERTINLNIHEPLFEINAKILYINIDNLRENISNQLIINEDYCSITSLYITDNHGILLQQTGSKILLFNGYDTMELKIPYLEKNKHHYMLNQEISFALSSSASYNEHYISIHTSEKEIVSQVFHLLNRSNIYNIKRPTVAVEHTSNTITYSVDHADDLMDTTIYAIGSSKELKLLTSNKMSSTKYSIFENLETLFVHDITNIEFSSQFKSNTELLHYKTIKNVTGIHNIITTQPYNSQFVKSINEFIDTSPKFYDIVSNYNGAPSVLNHIIYQMIFNDEWQEYASVKALKEYYPFLTKENCKIEVTYTLGNSTGTGVQYNGGSDDYNTYTLSRSLE